MNPAVLYVGQRVYVFVIGQGWRPATMTQVAPNLMARRDGLGQAEPWTRDRIATHGGFPGGEWPSR